MSLLSTFNVFVLTRARGRTILLMLAVAVGSFCLMAFAIAPAFQDATGGLRPFDMNFGITAETMYRDLPAYTDRSRTLYLWFALADFVYPAAAAAFFTLLWSWLFNKAPNPVYAVLMMKGILVFPCLFALVDWAENLGFLFVIFSYPAEHPTIGNVAGMLKKIKPFIEGAILALTLAFAVTTAWRRQKR